MDIYLKRKTLKGHVPQNKLLHTLTMNSTEIVGNITSNTDNNVISAESFRTLPSSSTVDVNEKFTTDVYAYTVDVTVEINASSTVSGSAAQPDGTVTNLSTSTSTVTVTEEEFMVVHSVASASLIISIVVSAGTLLYIFHTSKDQTFWKKRLCDRLVVYLAVCDLLFSISHLGEHSIALATGELPPGALCTMFGFFLGIFAGTQSVIVILTAVSAFCLMVRERGLSFGRYDWRLLLTAVGFPLSVGIVVAALDMYGRSEAW